MNILWKSSKCWSENHYIEVSKRALRATATATSAQHPSTDSRNKRNSCMHWNTERSELIQGRIHVEKRFISICYAFFFCVRCRCIFLSSLSDCNIRIKVHVVYSLWQGSPLVLTHTHTHTALFQLLNKTKTKTVIRNVNAV